MVVELLQACAHGGSAASERVRIIAQRIHAPATPPRQ
jgi:hypothetical protein